MVTKFGCNIKEGRFQRLIYTVLILGYQDHLLVNRKNGIVRKIGRSISNIIFEKLIYTVSRIGYQMFTQLTKPGKKIETESVRDREENSL